ncbi:MAG: hypothetical protein KDA62_19740 [Planctomycetales bacterium]|nr:hypothetical protein [Planctomycetales bacterium]
MVGRTLSQAGRALELLTEATAGNVIQAAPIWAQSAEQPRRLIERLEPMMRARVILLLLFIIILGAGLLLFAWLAGRMTRRLIRTPRDHRPPLDADDWAAKPLVKLDDPDASARTHGDEIE